MGGKITPCGPYLAACQMVGRHGEAGAGLAGERGSHDDLGFQQPGYGAAVVIAILSDRFYGFVQQGCGQTGMDQVVRPPQQRRTKRSARSESSIQARGRSAQIRRRRA